MALFDKKTTNKSSSSTKSEFSRDLRKARRFFEYGETASQARNYDYAIDCYISGLRFDPDNLQRHQEVREIALKRKVAGGKPPSLFGSVKKVGTSPVDVMLTAEKTWAMDPSNPKSLIGTIKLALDAEKLCGGTGGDPDDSMVEPLNLIELIMWLGEQAMEIIPGSAKPDRTQYTDLAEIFKGIDRLDKAVEACRRAVQMAPNDGELLMTLKNLEAEEYNRKHTSTEEGGFRDNLKDKDKQQEIQEELDTTGSQIDNLIKKRRAEWEEDRDSVDAMDRLADAMLRKNDGESERFVTALYMKCYELTNEFRWKVRAGDCQMRIYDRTVGDLRENMEKNPDDSSVKANYKKARTRQVLFELREYEERSKEYPTDMKVRFELGKRQFKGSMFDDAISAFQAAKGDPKNRAEANLYLGRCYAQKGWMEESVEAFETAISEHPFDDDDLAKSMRYELMLVLAKQASVEKDVDKADKALRLASSILQTDIKFRDIQDKMETIRALHKKLKG